MVRERTVRKQQDTSRLGPEMLAGPLARLAPLAEAWNTTAAECLEDAEMEAVHRLRTGSRRLQAVIEALLRENGPGSACEKPGRSWLRQLKKVRHAAGPVRDLDVHRMLLQNWSQTEVSEKSPLHTQAETLDCWLRGQRKQRANGLQKQIAKQQPKLAREESAFFLAFSAAGRGSLKAVPMADALALESFVRAADEMPLLDVENLHDFRKATKQARYVAEAETEGQDSSKVAKALKAIQDAIGEWHDWMCLANEAKTALGQEAPELKAALEQERERHFATAITTTQSISGQLVGEWMALHAKRPPAAMRDRPLAVAAGHRSGETPLRRVPARRAARSQGVPHSSQAPRKLPSRLSRHAVETAVPPATQVKEE